MQTLTDAERRAARVYDPPRARNPRLHRRQADFCIDFQNDGEYIDGCIAGGRQYAHINPAGDVEPCVFIHYSNANIHDKSLLECLQQPLFKEYHKGQPFNHNHLRPCPMLENPELLGEMVKRSGAHSTDMQQPESTDDVFRRCRPYADPVDSVR